MTAADIIAMFTFAEDRPLQVTLRNPQGKAWALYAPCKPPYISGQFEQPEKSDPVVRIALLDDQEFYTDFPVEKAGPGEKGSLVLTGSKGTATFQVGGQV